MTQLGLPIVFPFQVPVSSPHPLFRSIAPRKMPFLGPSPIKDNCIVKTTVLIIKAFGLWTEKKTIKSTPLPITILTRIQIYLFQSFSF